MIERWGVLARRLLCTSYRRDSRVDTTNSTHSDNPRGVHVLRETWSLYFCGELPRGEKWEVWRFRGIGELSILPFILRWELSTSTPQFPGYKEYSSEFSAWVQSSVIFFSLKILHTVSAALCSILPVCQHPCPPISNGDSQQPHIRSKEL